MMGGLRTWVSKFPRSARDDHAWLSHLAPQIVSYSMSQSQPTCIPAAWLPEKGEGQGLRRAKPPIIVFLQVFEGTPRVKQVF